jgi:hypothetical protein
VPTAPTSSPRRGHNPPPTSGRHGQATTEWLLLISVIVIAIVAAGAGLAATFGEDMESLGERSGTVYASGDLAR